MDAPHDFNHFTKRGRQLMEQLPHDGTGNKEAYHGKILKGNYSQDLKTYISDTTSRMRAFEHTSIPVIPYLSAWQEQKNAMWYEFAGQGFCHLMECAPGEIGRAHV